MYTILYKKQEDGNEAKWTVLESAQADEDGDLMAMFPTRPKALEKIRELGESIGIGNVRLLQIIALDWKVEANDVQRA